MRCCSVLYLPRTVPNLSAQEVPGLRWTAKKELLRGKLWAVTRSSSWEQVSAGRVEDLKCCQARSNNKANIHEPLSADGTVKLTKTWKIAGCSIFWETGSSNTGIPLCSGEMLVLRLEVVLLKNSQKHKHELHNTLATFRATGNSLTSNLPNLPNLIKPT